LPTKNLSPSLSLFGARARFLFTSLSACICVFAYEKQDVAALLLAAADEQIAAKLAIFSKNSPRASAETAR
jgi:hypothetical protein